MRRRFAAVFAFCLLLGGLSWSSAQAAPGPPPASDAGPLSVYTGVVDAAGLAAIVDLGVDRHELRSLRSRCRRTVRRRGDPQRRPGRSAGRRGGDADAGGTQHRRGALQAEGVFRPYSGPGGIQEELVAPGRRPPLDRAAAGDRPDRQRPGHHRRAGHHATRPRSRTATTDHRLHRRAARARVDHARDGPAPARPRARRLRHRSRRSPRLVEHNRAVVHPGRQPRRLRLHASRTGSGCGARTCATTTATARSRPATASTSTATSRPVGATTTRVRRRTPAARPTAGPSPASEPETQALDDLFAQHHARVLHQLPLGGRAAAVRHRLAGRDAVARRRASTRRWSATTPARRSPATTPTSPPSCTRPTATSTRTCRRRTARSASRRRCRRARRRRTSIPDDEWEPEDCESGFNFPDDEALIQAEFEKNIPFALAVAESAHDPDDPVSVVGIDTPKTSGSTASTCRTAIRRRSRSWPSAPCAA